MASRERKDTAGFFELLRHPRWVLMFVGQSISWVGDAITQLCVPLILLNLTGSATVASLGLSFELLPFLLLGSVAGAMVDRGSPKRILLIGDIVRAGLVLWLAFARQPWMIYLVVFFAQCVSIFFYPARSAVMPELVPREIYPKAVAVSTMAYQLNAFAGPAVASLLVFRMGLRQMFFLDSASFLVSMLCTALVAFPVLVGTVRAKQQRPGLLREAGEAFAWLRGQDVVRYLLWMGLWSFSLGITIFVITPAYVVKTLGLSGGVYGHMVSLYFLGSFTGAWLVGQLDGKLAKRWLLLSGAVLIGGTYMAVGLQPGYVGMLILWAMLGVGMGGYEVQSASLLAIAVPGEMRGRVMGLYLSARSVFPVTTAGLFGLVADRFGAHLAIAMGGLLLLVAVAVCTVFQPGFRALARQPHGGETAATASTV